MNAPTPIICLLLFPCGLFLIAGSLFYEWIDRKFVARFQNRIGPRWFQPFADIVKLLSKEEIVPNGVHRNIFLALPIVAFASVLTAGLYIPVWGFMPSFSFRADLIVTIYLLSVMPMCLGLAGANSLDRFSVIGATRTLTQMFAYEVPFMLALLLPALEAQSWNIKEIAVFASENTWYIVTMPLSFIIAVIGLIGKLELPPFDAPEAEQEIVGGPLVEYTGRGLGMFHLAKDVELVLGLSLVSAFYLGGIGNPLTFLAKTLILLLIVALIQSSMTRLRIDQTVGVWWKVGSLLVLLQLFITTLVRIL